MLDVNPCWFLREDCNKTEDETQWHADVEDEVSEMREEYEEDYQGEISRYKEAIMEWKEYMKQKVIHRGTNQPFYS